MLISREANTTLLRFSMYVLLHGVYITKLILSPHI